MAACIVGQTRAIGPDQFYFSDFLGLVDREQSLLKWPFSPQLQQVDCFLADGLGERNRLCCRVEDLPRGCSACGARFEGAPWAKGCILALGVLVSCSCPTWSLSCLISSAICFSIAWTSCCSGRAVGVVAITSGFSSAQEMRHTLTLPSISRPRAAL